MQPNPWDDGETIANQVDGVSLQDSIVSGDIHTSDAVHNQVYDPQQNYQQPSPFESERPDSLIVGSVQNFNNPMGQQVIYMQTTSSSPKVIGIFVIIWGAISLLGSLLNLVPVTDPITGEEVIVPQIAVIINFVNALFVGITCLLAGFWMTQYKRKGIHLAFVSLFFSYFFGLAAVYFGGDGGLGDLLGNDSAVLTLVAVIQGICSIICGLIVAIPLIGSAYGLDDSSLFNPLK